jgi:hypothetical protein
MRRFGIASTLERGRLWDAVLLRSGVTFRGWLHSLSHEALPQSQWQAQWQAAV